MTWDVLGDNANHRNKPEAYKDAATKYGRGSWSWIIANDASCNYDTQKKYIDFSAAMGWESLLVDAMWDVQIGRDRIAELAQYGKSKGVSLYLWYNSNGKWNDAPQTPRNCMDTPHHRRAEMAWMKSIGIRGIKVDFFGGDKQCTMQMYEDILSDAQDYGLMVIFHGCTLPRGWERMYPNFAACEAVRASENLHFGQSECDREAKDPHSCLHTQHCAYGLRRQHTNCTTTEELTKMVATRITSDVFALALQYSSKVQYSTSHGTQQPHRCTCMGVGLHEGGTDHMGRVRSLRLPGRTLSLPAALAASVHAGVNAEKGPTPSETIPAYVTAKQHRKPLRDTPN